mgnify:CR=1 FL=1
MCNVMNYDSAFHAPWFNIPHQDSYLQDLTTNLYSYKGQMSLPYKVTEYIDKPEGFDDEVTRPEQCFPYLRKWLYGDREWRVEYEAEMVYNRCIFYESDVMHSQNIDHGMFTEHDRVNQVFFL